MELNTLFCGCLLTAFFIAGILFGRNILTHRINSVPEDSNGKHGINEPKMSYEQYCKITNAAQEKDKDEISEEEQWDNIFAYDGKPQKKESEPQ